jgi:preprotein translocase subunit YajC
VGSADRTIRRALGDEWDRKGTRRTQELTSLQSITAILAQSTGGGGGMVMWLPLILIFVIFYFLLIMPQQKRQKKWQAMLNELKTGDRVMTQGGIAGTIVALRDTSIHLRVPPDNLRLEVSKNAVVSVMGPDDLKELKS